MKASPDDGNKTPRPISPLLAVPMRNDALLVNPSRYDKIRKWALPRNNAASKLSIESSIAVWPLPYPAVVGGARPIRSSAGTW